MRRRLLPSSDLHQRAPAVPEFDAPGSRSARKVCATSVAGELRIDTFHHSIVRTRSMSRVRHTPLSTPTNRFHAAWCGPVLFHRGDLRIPRS